MAEEIVAKYKVDVDGATKALDALIAKMSQTGKSLEDSFVKGSDGVKRLQEEIAKQPKTIAELELRLVRLKELLRDDTQVGTQGFKAVTAAIKETQFQIDKTSGKLGSVSAKVKQAIRESAAETEKARIKQEEYNKSLSKTPTLGDNILNKFKAVGAALLAAFAVDRLVAFGKEAITLAASAEGVERAFAKIGSPELLQGLRDATNGTVTDLVLMQSAVKASNFKIPLDQLGSLLKYAQMQARATGQDVDYLVESLITGIGRKSVLVLDNLQISAVELREKLGDVSLETATVGQVAEAVGTIASASFAKMGAQALTTADEIAQMETAWTNFKTSLGGTIISALRPIAQAMQLVSVDAQKVAEVTLATQQMNAIQLLRELKIRQQIADEALKAYDPRGGGRDELKLAVELLNITQKEYDLRVKMMGGGNEEEAPKPSEIDVSIQAKINKQLEEEAKLRASQIRNLFAVDADLKLLNDELGLQSTSLERITAILPLITALEEERKTILGQETEAMKKLRLEMEALDKVERKRADEYNKAQAEEAERLLKQEEDNAKERVKIAEDMAKMLIDIEDYLATTSNEILDRDLAYIARNAQDRIDLVNNAGAENVLSVEEQAAAIVLIEAERDKLIEQAEQDHSDRIFAINKELADKKRDLAHDELKEEEEKKEREMRLFEAVANTTVQLIGMVSQAQQESYQRDLDNLQERLDQGLISEEEYDKEKRNLLTKQNEAAKQAAIFQAIINTAVAVTAAAGVPVIGFALAILAGILGAAQIALITSQQPPAFAKGVVDLQGEGTATSDSIHAKLSKGESVITAKETSKHKGLLEAMNKGLAEKYILSNYVKPALDSAMLSGFADIGKSAEVNGLTANLKDHNIIAAMDRHRAADVAGFKMLAAKLDRRQPKRGGYA